MLNFSTYSRLWTEGAEQGRAQTRLWMQIGLCCGESFCPEFHISKPVVLPNPRLYPQLQKSAALDKKDKATTASNLIYLCTLILLGMFYGPL